MDDSQKRDRWHVAIDVRDVMLGVGAVATIAGAASFHWGLALMATGAAIAAIALWLGRR